MINAIKITLRAVILPASLALLHAADTPMSDSVICTDHNDSSMLINSNEFLFEK